MSSLPIVQFRSSSPSGQSGCPSHWFDKSMQLMSAHEKSDSAQGASMGSTSHQACHNTSNIRILRTSTFAKYIINITLITVRARDDEHNVDFINFV